ncbi:MAG: adenylyltransferase/cytidyltransferase family protein [Candidatus Magnetoovum sp. WYHC-5]|nr:adenylyltransferase/cytidyltransferase family protein [Candidatus Magnetoovum sp. WYHC-5]
MTGQVLALSELKNRLEREKRAGRKVVFTNGCFDILHKGHVEYLVEAKGFGDILVVGINSDISVGRLKPGRPIINESDRAFMVASLFMVDYTTIFNEDTPYELIKALAPHVLVKGGDWKKDEIVGNDIVPEVYSLSYIPGISTTDIINKIVKNSGF